ncbi:hypothetical protein H4219_005900, partial [Mycoemilia scoparia]
LESTMGQQSKLQNAIETSTNADESNEGFIDSPRYLDALVVTQIRNIENLLTELLSTYKNSYSPIIRQMASLSSPDSNEPDNSEQTTMSKLFENSSNHDLKDAKPGDLSGVSGINRQWTTLVVSTVAQFYKSEYIRHIDLLKTAMKNVSVQSSFQDFIDKFLESTSELTIATLETEIRDRLRIYRLAREYQGQSGISSGSI